jgi:hypothetical protein
METEIERQHHPYGGSQLQSLEVCPHFKSRESKHARTIAGTLAHKVVETREDNLDLGDDDAAAAAECLDFIEQRVKYLSEVNPHCSIRHAQEIYLPIDDCVFEDCTATSAGWIDKALLLEDNTGKIVYAELFDWKFGKWPVEKAENNLQGFAYALGLFKKYPTLSGVHVFFRQPLIQHFTDAVILRDKAAELYLRIQVVVARARAARKSNDFSAANPHVPVCNFCDHIAECPKVREFACHIGKKFDPVSVPQDITPTTVMSPEQTVIALNLAQVVKVWADAFRKRVHERVLRGDAELPPGYAIEFKRAARKIVDKEVFKRVALEYITEDDLKQVADYGFGDVEELVAKYAPRMKKSERLEEFKQKLIEAQAVQPGEPFSYLTKSKETKNTNT